MIYMVKEEDEGVAATISSSDPSSAVINDDIIFNEMLMLPNVTWQWSTDNVLKTSFRVQRTSCEDVQIPQFEAKIPGGQSDPLRRRGAEDRREWKTAYEKRIHGATPEIVKYIHY